jgi:hypothetical protein
VPIRPVGLAEGQVPAVQLWVLVWLVLSCIPVAAALAAAGFFASVILLAALRALNVQGG